MATHKLDTKGMKCPQPVLKIASMIPNLASGDVLELVGDCPTIEQDVRKWCERMNKTLLAVNRDGEVVSFQIQF